jgi:hypothetical protein
LIGLKRNDAWLGSLCQIRYFASASRWMPEGNSRNALQNRGVVFEIKDEETAEAGLF